MWRFKTLEEFKEEGLCSYSYPDKFNDGGEMDYLLGTYIDKKFHYYCEQSLNFNIKNTNPDSGFDDWCISSFHYTNKPLPNQQLNYEIF